MALSRKRKQRSYHSSDRPPRSTRAFDRDDPAVSPAVDSSLFIVAHEADVVRGPQAAYAADSLEVTLVDANGESSKRVGDSLIMWERSGQQEDVWVDRYDARLLLDALPTAFTATTVSSGAGERPSSPSGWSDLPSDAEDTFFFSPEETDDYHRDKRRRQIDRLREDRLKALQNEDHEADADTGERWGGSDEEPDEAEVAIMRRTATHVLSSPNPAHLEMRILANHGADPRFAFLRGRWSRAWALTKAVVRQETITKETAEKREKERKTALGGLMGYDDSDSDADEDDGKADEELSKISENARADSAGQNDGGGGDANAEDAARQARRERAKKWVDARRAARSTGRSGEDILEHTSS
ncbi:hypothetical protein FA95DRAFT_1533194 [Auriscalpium vulgare]|uniref:Uncharacterized protein n=1 Tax=Auriscalpium vulgare TaxID=40419 RepID=A0ACB8S8R9_9AGAM|nr:hypothetical protein FA95DRAFT_1533194 [Auriscalpium vulgare]